MAVVRVLSHNVVQETGKQSAPGEQLRMLSEQHAGLYGAHGQPGHGPVLSVLLHPVFFLDKGNDILNKDLRKQVLLQPDLSRPAIRHHHSIRHHDQHGNRSFLRQQVVHDMVDFSLPDPAPFILPEAVLKIQDRIFFFSLLIARRYVADTGLGSARHGGIQILMPDRPVRHIPHKAEVLHRPYLQEIDRPAAAISNGKERAQYQAVIHVQAYVIKAGIQRQIHRPHILIRFQERISYSADLNLYIRGICKAQPQIWHSFCAVKQSLLSGNGHRILSKLQHDRTMESTGLLHNSRIIQPFLIRIHLLPYLQRQPFCHSLCRAQRPDHTIQISAQSRMIPGYPFHNNMQPSGCHGQKIVNIIQTLSLSAGQLQLFLQIFMQLLSGMYSGKIQLDHVVISFFFLHRLSPFSACS